MSDFTDIDTPHGELRGLIARQIHAALLGNAETLPSHVVMEIADAVMTVFNSVVDDWTMFDTSTATETKVLWDRSLVATVRGRPSVVARTITHE